MMEQKEIGRRWDKIGLNINNQRMMKTIEGYSYCVGECIGKGYSSTVHKGVKDESGEMVAIKVIELAKLEDPINHMLLEMEVAALRAVAHSPHSLHLLNVYATRNNTYLITELCDGDLATLIRQRKTIPYSQAVSILTQLVAGYLDIHAAGLVHRDVKPANILYTNSVFKFADFGFAVPINALSEHRGYNVGSPVYMPPEALKENNYSVSCDTWAIGIIFYQMLSGVVPWRSLNEKTLYEKMINSPIHNFTSRLPSQAAAFLSHILSVDPLLRPTPYELQTWMPRLAASTSQNISPFLHRFPSAQFDTIHAQKDSQNISSPSLHLHLPSHLSIVSNQTTSSRPHCSEAHRHLKQNNLASRPLSNTHHISRPLQENKSNGAKGPQQISFNYSLSPPPQNFIQLTTPSYISSITPAQNMQNKENFLPSIPPLQEKSSSFSHPFISINPLSNHSPLFAIETNLTPSQQSSNSKHLFFDKKDNNHQFVKEQSSLQQDFKQSEIFIKNLTKYIHFIQRLLKFMGPPTTVLLPQIERLLCQELHEKIEIAIDLLKGKKQIKISGFRRFIQSDERNQILRELQVRQAKDKMFFPVTGSKQKFSFVQVSKAVHQLMNFLKLHGFDPKTILAADYLTTYLLLKKKEQNNDIVEFMRISKIELIMQGCPYLVQKEHLLALQTKVCQMKI